MRRRIAEDEKELEAAKKQKKTLQNELWIIGQEVKKINLEIKESNLVINGLETEINDANNKIVKIDEKIETQKVLIAATIRNLYETSDKSFLEIILAQSEIVDFFEEMKALEDIQRLLKESLDAIKSLKIDLGNKIEVLEEKQEDLSQTKRLQEFQKVSLGQKKKENDNLLKETQGKEILFQNLINKSQKDIGAIRAQIRYLEQSGITAEDAVKFAKLAAVGAGIRPAFLLALLEWETGLGRNVGRCYLKDPVTATGINILTGATINRVMKPMGLSGRKGDVDDFIVITRELGFDPFSTPISCPQKGVVGYGGAMGPAQFIPTTWVGYKAEVARITGNNPPNPWNIEDAFTASAIKLARSGATAKTREAEIAAAKAYYSGNSRCSTASCNKYANGIQSIAAEIEKNL